MTVADDIVTRIREEAKKQTTLGQAFDMLHVADEIERLRAAGDALASAFEEIPQWPEWFYQVYETWLEVRRGHEYSDD